MKKIFGGVLLCILQVVIGILLLIKPIGFTKGILITLGIVLAFCGLISIVDYFRANAQTAKTEKKLFKGLLFLLIGCVGMFSSNWIIGTFPLLTVVYGFLIIIVGLGKVQMGVDLIRGKEKGKVLTFISAAISLICGAIIMSNPFSTTVVLWTFTGISLIVDAVFDVIALIFGNKEKKNG